MSIQMITEDIVTTVKYEVEYILCDACGTQEKQINKHKINYGWKKWGDYSFDVCPSCAAKINSFIEGLKNDNQQG